MRRKLLVRKKFWAGHDVISAATERVMTDRESLRRLRDLVALALAFAVVLGTTLLARSDASRIEDARASAHGAPLGPT